MSNIKVTIKIAGGTYKEVTGVVLKEFKNGDKQVMYKDEETGLPKYLIVKPKQ